ncbi:MAG: UDP-2,3-diacylglucosamine diphosphatase [Bacteroidales bacterium]|nr:UDP-2,3-diacylglucosamine diphosphatase [Bacteroidales bacterium]
MSRHLTYFVSDVHLGLQVAGPDDREARFVDFLRGIPAPETEALYLLGDIWDFWYEYRDVVPKGYVRVFAALTDLMDAGVKVYFFPGNHDIWTYRYFEELGMTALTQPHRADIGGARFCLGHGDGLGPGNRGYKLMRWGFHNRFLQACFSALHPWFAFRLGNGWSRRSRLGKSVGYTFRGTEEPLYQFCEQYAAAHPVDYFVFGHYHCAVDLPVGRARLLVLRDWITVSNWMVYDAATARLCVFPPAGA